MEAEISIAEGSGRANERVWPVRTMTEDDIRKSGERGDLIPLRH